MFQNLNWLRSVGLILVFILVSGCAGPADPLPAESYPSPDASGEGYPGPPTEYDGPGYPVDDSYEELFNANLTPNAPAPEVTNELGALTIKLIYVDTDRPVRGQSFFAAEMLPVQGVEDAFIPKLDTSEAREGQSDSQGVLVISRIIPDKYALVLMTPLGPILVESQETSDTVTFDISAGEVTDLGTVIVLLDPDPLEP